MNQLLFNPSKAISWRGTFVRVAGLFCILVSAATPACWSQETGVYVNTLGGITSSASVAAENTLQPLVPMAFDDVVPSVADSATAQTSTPADNTNASPPAADDQALAQKQKTKNPWPSATAAVPDLSQLVPKLAVSLVVVLGGCCGCLMLVKRCGWHRRFGSGTSTAATGTRDSGMRVLETLRLEGKATLKLIEVNGQKILVGADAGGIKSILNVGNFAEALAEYKGE